MTGWKYRLSITIDKDKIDDGLDNWTLIFDQSFNSVLTSVNGPLDADGLYPSLNGGGDIRFSSDINGSNRLACDIRNWATNNDPSSATCEAAVKITEVSDTEDTTIYMWWGKSGETQPSASDTYGQYNAYDSNHELVLPNGASPDRTSNQRPTTDTSITSGDDTGKVGMATNYAGNSSGDRCEIGDTSDWDTILSYNHAFTIEGLWELENASTSVPCVLISRIQSSTIYRGVSITYAPSSTDLTCAVQETHTPSVVRFGKQNTSFNWSDDTWKHIAFTYDGTSVSSSGVYMYSNGATTGTGLDEGTVATTSHSDPLLVGSRNWGAPSTMREWDGDIDEVRISSVERSAAWIKANYNNFFNTSGFLTWGEITEVSQGKFQAFIII